MLINNINKLDLCLFNLILEFTNTHNLKLTNKYCYNNVLLFYNKKNTLLNTFIKLYKQSKKFNNNDIRFFINQFPYCTFCNKICHKLISVEFTNTNDSFLTLLKIINPICNYCFFKYNNSIINHNDINIANFLNIYIYYFNVDNINTPHLHFIDFIDFYNDVYDLNIEYINLIGSNYHIVYTNKFIKKNYLHN